MTSAATDVPLGVRLMLGHAAAQHVANRQGLDILHIKGHALDPDLRWDGRVGTDVDVMVRPAHLSQYLQALLEAGWAHAIGFEEGSPFGHAATLTHEQWGYLDVHRMYPGFTVSPSDAFEALWRDRGNAVIAGMSCPVPSMPGQVVVVMLHAGRSGAGGRTDLDIDAVWSQAPDALQQEVRQLVADLGAEVAFAAATGHLDDYRDRREYALWKAVSRGGTRVEEWFARIKAAPTLAARIRLALKAPLVNIEHLTMLWGRPPTRTEVLHEFFARPVRGVVEEWRSFRRREHGRR